MGKFADMSDEEFKNYKSVRVWTNYLSAEGTERLYLSKLKRFCDWVGKDPDTLIEERYSLLRSEDIRENHEHEELATAFLKDLEKTLSPYALRSYAGAIRSFYKYNRADLKLIKQVKVYNIREEKIPTKEEVKGMCEVSGTRERAVILFQYQSGLRNDTIAKLRYRDIKEDLEAGLVPARVHVMPGYTKCKIGHDTFVGRDAIEAFKASLDERRRGVAVRGAPPEKITDKSPLFRSGRNIPGGPITSSAISHIVVEAALRAGIVEVSESEQGTRTKYISLHAHCLRKAFQTTLEASRVSSNWVKSMMGHKLPRVEGAYSKPSVKQLREAYSKAESSLSISETKPVLRSEEIKEIVDKRVEGRIKELFSDPKLARALFASYADSLPPELRTKLIVGIGKPEKSKE